MTEARGRHRQRGGGRLPGCEAALRAGLRASDWVNDLYYNGKKVCGILTEAGADIESGQLEWLVVGIGLNLTSRPEDWPEELRPIAGSLYPGGPAPVSRAGTGRGHRPGTAGSLPGLRLSGRVPRPVLCAGPLGHGLHRDGELRRKGGGHRRRRAASSCSGKGAAPRRFATEK